MGDGRRRQNCRSCEDNSAVVFAVSARGGVRDLRPGARPCTGAATELDGRRPRGGADVGERRAAGL